MMTTIKTRNILRVVIPPLLIIGFTLISSLKAKTHIDKGHHRHHDRLHLRGKTEKMEHKEVESKIRCPHNQCVFKPCLKFKDRLIEGRFGFGYAINRTLFGQATITYKNTKTMNTKHLGFEIIIKYLEGEKVTIRLNILYGRNWKLGKAGLYLQDYIPPVCYINPVSKLCVKMTQATFFEKCRIQFCFKITVKLLRFINKDLYARCMNFTTPPISSLKNRVARLPMQLKKLTQKKKRRTTKRDILVEGGDTDVKESERKDIIIPID